MGYFLNREDPGCWDGEGNGTPLQYSCLANPMGGGLSDFPFTFHFHALEKEMATHSSVLAWRITGMGEPGGLPSMGSHRVGHDWSDLAAAAAWDLEQNWNSLLWTKICASSGPWIIPNVITTSLSLNLPQPYPSSSCYFKISSVLLPQCFCTCSFLCLKPCTQFFMWLTSTVHFVFTFIKYVRGNLLNDVSELFETSYYSVVWVKNNEKDKHCTVSLICGI